MHMGGGEGVSDHGGKKRGVTIATWSTPIWSRFGEGNRSSENLKKKEWGKKKKNSPVPVGRTVKKKGEQKTD